MEKRFLVRELFIVSNKIRRELERLHSQNGLYIGQARVLSYLYQCVKEPVYQKDIESHLSIRGASVTGLIDSMVSTQMLNRVESEKDKRKKKLVLTEKGKDLAKKAITTWTEFEDDLSNMLPEEDIIDLIDKLRKVRNILDEKEKNIKWVGCLNILKA